MNMESLWEQTCTLLCQDMNLISYKTWVEGNMQPAEIRDDTMLISVKMDSMIPMLQKKYQIMIEKHLSESAGAPMRVRLLSKSDIEKTTVDPPPPDGNDPHLNPKYTLRTLWSAAATGLHTPLLWR